jgi:hypothetical protein
MPACSVQIGTGTLIPFMMHLLLMLLDTFSSGPHHRRIRYSKSNFFL